MDVGPMDAYDRADFDRLEEIHAEDAQWINASMEAAEAALAGPGRSPANRWWRRR
jgi:hypothetical protein